MYEINYQNIHYVPLDMERNYHDGVDYRLKITETTDVAKKTTEIRADIQYANNSGADILSVKHSATLEINGNKSTKSYTTHYVGDGQYRSLSAHIVRAEHDANGNAGISVKVTFKADEFLILEIYQTKGSASYSGQIKPIDMSAPKFESISVSANRYGKNAAAMLAIGNHSYKISAIYFTLKGLTEEQAKSRKATITQESDGTYSATFGATDVYPDSIISFNLDGYYSDIPLDTGKTYSYVVSAYSPTGAYTTKPGSFYVPQKVTGIACESLVELMMGGWKYLEYQVSPQNSEEQSVTFKSSNDYVATVDKDGTIEAKHDGVCFVTVTTVDGGFSATCEVRVTDYQIFPYLAYTEYLSENVVGNIISATLFLRNKLVEKGVSVPEFPTVVFKGKSHPVKDIRNVLEAIESCCQILKTASDSRFPCASLSITQNFSKENTDKQWFFFVNEWINFLNELNEKTK